MPPLRKIQTNALLSAAALRRNAIDSFTFWFPRSKRVIMSILSLAAHLAATVGSRSIGILSSNYSRRPTISAFTLLVPICKRWPMVPALSPARNGSPS